MLYTAYQQSLARMYPLLMLIFSISLDNTDLKYKKKILYYVFFLYYQIKSYMYKLGLTILKLNPASLFLQFSEG